MSNSGIQSDCRGPYVIRSTVPSVVSADVACECDHVPDSPTPTIRPRKFGTLRGVELIETPSRTSACTLEANSTALPLPLGCTAPIPTSIDSQQKSIMDLLLAMGGYKSSRSMLKSVNLAAFCHEGPSSNSLPSLMAIAYLSFYL